MRRGNGDEGAREKALMRFERKKCAVVFEENSLVLKKPHTLLWRGRDKAELVAGSFTLALVIGVRGYRDNR